MPRFFSKEPLAHLSIGVEWRLPESVFHHAVRVRRLRLRDTLTLFDGSGACWRAVVARIDKHGATVVVNEYVANSASNTFSLTLALPVMSAERMDWALQKGTELGVHAFWPMYSAHSANADHRKHGEKRYAHWRNVLASACEQCGRNVLPELKMPAMLEEVLLAEENRDVLRFLFDAGGEKGLTSLLHQTLSRAPQSVILLIGPEGGFSRSEIALARQHRWQIAHLGPRILRAETAIVAAATLTQAALGDLGRAMLTDMSDF